MGHYFNAGLAKMSGVAMLLVGTGALSGIISNSGLKDVIISFIETLGLPGFMLAPISGMLMGAATASATAGTTLGQPDLWAYRGGQRRNTSGGCRHDPRELLRL